LDEIEAHQVDAVVSGDVGCLMQIGNRLRKRGSTVQTMHIAELLANAS
jgi:L-lactate dehydrogenase complex protein LldE